MRGQREKLDIRVDSVSAVTDGYAVGFRGTVPIFLRNTF